MEENSNQYLNELTQSEYKYGFFTDVEMDSAPKGLNEDIIRFISKKKNEPEFMLEFRLKAYAKWLTMKMPDWAHLKIPPIDFQDIIYYSAPKHTKKLGSLYEVDPELLKTFEKLGIPLN
ncbi:MAG: Fe-S cluster assembly protein SufB, partial [Bacteroidota bacterium]